MTITVINSIDAHMRIGKRYGLNEKIIASWEKRRRSLDGSCEGASDRLV